MSKVFITGASGYVGITLVKMLFEQGHKITVLSYRNGISSIKDYVDFITGDVRDSKLVEVIKDYDYLIHLASVIDISSGNKKFMYDVNINGVKNIVNICLKNNIKLIHCSSVHALTPLKNNELMTETTNINPQKVIGAYSKSKAIATKYIIDQRKNKLDAMIAYPSGIIGAGELRVTNIGQVISDFLCGSLKTVVKGHYNFVDVHDVAFGIMKMMENYKTGSDYLLTGYKISVKELIDTVATTCNKKTISINIPFPIAYATSLFSEAYAKILRKKPLFTRYSLVTLRTNCNFSFAKARKDLGYEPISAQESLKEMTNWIINHFVKYEKGKYLPSKYYN